MGETLQHAAHVTAQQYPQLSKKLQYHAVDAMKMQGVLVQIGVKMSDLDLVGLVNLVKQKLQSQYNSADVITPEERHAISTLRQFLGTPQVKIEHFRNPQGVPQTTPFEHQKFSLVYLETDFGKVLASTEGKALYTCVGDVINSNAWTPFMLQGMPPQVPGLAVINGNVFFEGRQVYTFKGDNPGEVNGHGVNDGSIWAAVVPK